MPHEVKEIENCHYYFLLPMLVDAKICKSNAEGNRLLKQGAIDLIHRDGSIEKLTERSFVPSNGDKLHVGKRRWLRLEVPPMKVETWEDKDNYYIKILEV